MQGIKQHALRVIFAPGLPVKLVEQQQVTVQIAHQAQAARIFIQLFEYDFSRFKFAQQNLRSGDITPLALQEVVIGKLRFRRLAQPVGGRLFIADHLPVDHPNFIGV